MTEKANNCPLFPGCSSDHRSARINHTATLSECSCWNWWIRWRVWCVTGRQWEAKTVLLTPLRNFFQVLILLSLPPPFTVQVCKRREGVHGRAWRCFVTPGLKKQEGVFAHGGIPYHPIWWDADILLTANATCGLEEGRSPRSSGNIPPLG